MEDTIKVHERISALEQDKSSVHRRLDNLEKLVESVHVIATELKATRNDVSEIKERVEEVEHRPQKRYDTIVTAIITSIIGGLIGYFIKM